MTNRIRLNGDLLDLAILRHDRVSLAAVCAEHRGSGELDVPGAGEGAVCVAEEADAGGLVGVEGLAPGVHARVGVRLVRSATRLGRVRTRKHH